MGCWLHQRNEVTKMMLHRMPKACTFIPHGANSMLSRRVHILNISMMYPKIVLVQFSILELSPYNLLSKKCTSAILGPKIVRIQELYANQGDHAKSQKKCRSFGY